MSHSEPTHHQTDNQHRILGRLEQPDSRRYPRLTSCTSTSDCDLAQVSHATGPFTQANNPGRRSGTATTVLCHLGGQFVSFGQAIFTDTAVLPRFEALPTRSKCSF
jgi:hypothetical protein